LLLTGVCLEVLRLGGLGGGSTLDRAYVLSGILVATGLRGLRDVSATFVLALATAAAAAFGLAHAVLHVLWGELCLPVLLAG
jgi:hypothetical protein